MKNKRAELSTQQIIMMIILITSFVVVLFFLFRLNLGEGSQDQLCHNSVIQKASVLSQAPLQCYRDYVCITEDGTCEGLVKPEKVKVKSLGEVYETLANEMADCWWMFGEGKVDYVGSEVTKNNYCSICSQILFDDSLENLEGVENKKIGKDELYDYLATNNYSKDLTYAKYLRLPDPQAIKDETQKSENIGTFGTIDIGNQYFTIMGITSQVSTADWFIRAAAIGGGVAVSVLAVVGTGGGAIPFVAVLVGEVATGIVGVGGAEIADSIDPEIAAIMVPGDGIDNQFMAPTILEVDSAKFKALNCEEILTYT